MNFFETEQGQQLIDKSIENYQNKKPVEVAPRWIVSRECIDDDVKKFKAQGDKDPVRTAIIRNLKPFDILIESTQGAA